MTARIIDYKAHEGLPGNWRARKVRWGTYVIEVELPCINGLSAWFSIGTFQEAEDDERLMTDGARLETGEYAERFAAAPAAIRSLIDRTRALEAALQPFADLLDTESNGYESSPDEEIVRSVGTLGNDYAVITVGDLRRARAALKDPS